MKNTKDVVAVVYDHGLFVELALRLARDFKKVYYVCPWESSAPVFEDWVVGRGFDAIEKVEEIWDAKDIDLAIFPDIHHAGLQAELEKQGIPVWGSRRADEFEMGKLKCKKLLKQLGMPVSPYTVVVGIENLRIYCQQNEDKWIKLVRQFRGNRETFHHSTYDESRGIIDKMALDYGGFQNRIGFICEEPIAEKEGEPMQEVGIDTVIVDGEHPEFVSVGKETKDRSYVVRRMKFADLDPIIRGTVDPLFPVLADHGYRQFFSSESKGNYLLEPTLRAASPAGEAMQEMIANLPEVIWRGAQGELVEPEWQAEFCVQVLLTHHHDDEGPRMLVIPEEVKPFTKLFYASQNGEGVYEIKPKSGDLIGTAVGLGDTFEKAVAHLHETLAALPKCVGYDLSALKEGFDEFKAAEKEGLEGIKAGEVPDAEEVLGE